MLLPALLLAACVAPETPVDQRSSILGGWWQAPTLACRDTLAFSETGRFVHNLALEVGARSALRAGGGTYTGGPETDDNGEVRVALTPSAPWADDLPADCDQWQQAARLSLSFAELEALTGLDPGALVYRSLALPHGGWAWLGTHGATETDRFALLRDGNRLRGFLLDPAAGGAAELFHREPLALPSHYPAGGLVVVNLPQHTWRAVYPAAAPNASLANVLLSVHSAAAVTFSPRPVGAAYPLCTLAVWDSADFQGAPRTPNPLGNVEAVPTVILNPKDPTAPLVTAPHWVDEQPEVLHLLPLAVHGPASGGCEVTIQARPLAADAVEAHLAQPPAGAPLDLPVGTSPAYLLARPGPDGSGLRTVPLQGPDTWPQVRLLEWLVQPAGGVDTLLASADGAGRTARISIRQSAGQAQLSLYPTDGSRTGLGPFRRPKPAPSTLPLAPGANQTVGLAVGDPPAVLRVHLSQPAVVQFSTRGDVLTAARLQDATGTDWAIARGGDGGGAADGAGFRIVAALAAGDYTLYVEALVPPATFTVAMEVPESLGLADLHLEACLLATLPPAAAPAAFRAADCSGQGVTSLAGIGGLPGLRHLRLDGNAINDLLPLAALMNLETLSLARTAVADLSPLVGAAQLHRLSLAGLRLDAAAVAILSGMAGRLTELDLRGVTGLTDADLATLRVALPMMVLVEPDGTVRY